MTLYSDTPIYAALQVERAGQEAAQTVSDGLARHLTVVPFAARVCDLCGATGKEPCVTASGKVLRRYHVARG